MSLGKKTIKIVQNVLKDKDKRKLYSEEELLYMEKQLVLLKELRKIRVRERKENKGFSTTKDEVRSSDPHRSIPRPTE